MSLSLALCDQTTLSMDWLCVCHIGHIANKGDKNPFRGRLA